MSVVVVVMSACALPAAATPTVASAATAWWYQQGSLCGIGSSFDCFSLSTPSSGTTGYGNQHVLDTAVANFIPDGDCMSYAPACYGGYISNSTVPSNWGTYCIDYSGNGGDGAGGDQANCADRGNGSWTLTTGTEYGDSCGTTTASQCGTHLLIGFGQNVQSDDLPFSYGTGSVLHVGDVQDNLTYNAAWHAYVCADFFDPSTPHFIEDCEYNYFSSASIESNGGSASCNGTSSSAYINHSFTTSPWSDPYGSNQGADSYVGAGPSGSHQYAFTTTYAQMQAALIKLNSQGGCGGSRFDTNPADWELVLLEAGLENWSNANENSGFQTESGLWADTTY